MSNDKFVDVVVSWSEEDGVTVEPEKVTLKWDYSPNAIRWVVKNAPDRTKLKIVWGVAKKQDDVACPFKKIQPNPATDKEIKGTGNKKVEDEYTYTVLFVDNKGQVVAGIDPKILNGPGP